MSGPPDAPERSPATARHYLVGGTAVPRLIYGTAWKEHQTRRLVEDAILTGFWGIDTANQRKHYDEDGVGQGIRDASMRKGIARDQLFIQTKFTFRAGQDHRLPYDPKAPIGDQVHQSFARSLTHLRTDRLDSYVLHGPSTRNGLGAADFEAWSAMEEIWDGGRITFLGVSNMSPAQVAQLLARARVRPTFVQNRCYATRGWDRDMRAVCREAGMFYQGFSLLTANRQVLGSDLVKSLGRRLRLTPAQVILRFALDIGMIALTGTTDTAHMKDDQALFETPLSDPDIQALERMAISS